MASSTSCAGRTSSLPACSVGRRRPSEPVSPTDVHGGDLRHATIGITTEVLDRGEEHSRIGAETRSRFFLSVSLR